MREILINQVFAGAYLQEGTNIGHEIINFFMDDDEQNYLYITPSGNVKNHDVDKVLFVQNIKGRETMEVVMKAEGLRTVDADEIKKISYAGVNIVDIFRKNMYHGKSDAILEDTVVTYRAEKVMFPRKDKRIIVTVDTDYKNDDDNSIVIRLDSDKNKIVGQGMRTYVSKDIYCEIYENVEKMMENNSLWEEHEESKLISNESTYRTNITFLEIIRKENDELIMSNLLTYYFNYNHKMFAEFAKEVLKIDCFSSSFEIVREKMKNIDIWVRDKNNVVVIENKIKSGLNGKTSDGKNQLNKYYEFTEKLKKDKNIENAYYYIFIPNYNSLIIEDTIIKEKYKIIYYSEIYEFFRKNAAEYLGDKLFADFLCGLKNQTMTFSEMRFSIMKSRFLEKINQN